MEYQKIRTLGELKASGYKTRSVKEEIRSNLIAKLKSGQEIFPGIVGYERTVIPQLQNALLSRHDIILLGLRGQAKTKLIRMMTNLLDEVIPIVKGSEINDSPFNPLSKFARERVLHEGDETEIAWIPREQRYSEKLATPDVTIADLIGDIDPIKAATQRLSYADENVIHYGIIPRTNRGIFAINELPDLQPRIQVGLLNIMQEKDIQIRGFQVRIPLDIFIIFSANPEDYTNRGNIITPLKDRIDSQIITHYPRTIESGIDITMKESWTSRPSVKIEVPYYFRELIEHIAFEARKSEYIDQKSGVSARLTISAMENLVSNAERRAILNEEATTLTRISDLFQTIPAITGKIELVYEGEQEGAINVAKMLVGKAVLQVFKKYCPDPNKKVQGQNAYHSITNWFAQGNTIDIYNDMKFDDYAAALSKVKGLKEVTESTLKPRTKDELATGMEFILEGLYQHSMVGKDELEASRTYSDMIGKIMSSVGGNKFER
ncbi:MAG: sigma 54-interacting transcriptional regulator [Chloroherpetonaceae bacterium]|nr:sigma 54-interacting transcriptional regulator [Chloroherpetonaceae bacterium]